jgi:REP-associated tyrosine transposase
MDWPDAPIHRIEEPGCYFVTGATYLKAHVFRSPDRLDYLQGLLFKLARSYQLELRCWSVFSNHYHFIVYSERTASSLKDMISELHSVSGREVNPIDGQIGRKVWYQFWDKHLTFERSYLARLNYVNQNPVHHGIVENATNYRWCSAAWFEANVTRAFAQSVKRFRCDRLNIFDDFFESGGKPPHSEGGGKPPHSEGDL